MSGFAVLISYFVYSSVGDDSTSAGPPGRGGGTTADDIEQAGGMLAALGTVSTLAGIVVLSLWAIAAASDYDTGLIRVLVQAQPSRLKLIAGKLIALSGFTAIASAVVVLTTMAIAGPLSSAFDLDRSEWSTNVVVEVAQGLFNFAAPTLVWGLLGLMIAVLTRSSGLAIGIGIGWLLVVENLIGIAAPDTTHLMPGGTLSALASGGTSDLSWSTALGLSSLYGLAAITITMITFHRRDIVS